MPQITKVEPQKKNANRFNIFVDEKFAFGVSAQNLLTRSLKVGKILSSADIEKIAKYENLSKLQDIAMQYLNYRPRSEKEIKDHLAKKLAQKENIKFSQAQQSPLIQTAITKLKKYKFINDLEFAKWFVTSRQKNHTKSSRIISIELKLKGIDEKIIQKVLTAIVNEKDLAIRALQKKVKRWANLPEVERKKKIYQFLLFKGFSYDIAKEAFAFFEKKD